MSQVTVAREIPAYAGFYTGRGYDKALLLTGLTRRYPRIRVYEATPGETDIGTVRPWLHAHLRHCRRNGRYLLLASVLPSRRCQEQSTTGSRATFSWRAGIYWKGNGRDRKARRRVSWLSLDGYWMRIQVHHSTGKLYSEVSRRA